MSKPKKTEYEVGYAKPPKETRFKKGQSGNAAGRPKGKLNLATVVEQAMNATVVVNEGGQRQTKSKLEVALTQLMNKAASGDLKAIRMAIGLAPGNNTSDADNQTPDRLADRELAKKLAARLLVGFASRPETNPDEQTPD